MPTAVPTRRYRLTFPALTPIALFRFVRLLFREGLRAPALVIAAAFLLATGPALAQEGGRVDLPRFPSISPDGSEVVFSWGGDLWLGSIEGGNARRLTRHHLDDMYSTWSPDGEWIAFTSMRDGHLNLWRIRPDGTQLTQVTHSDQFIRNPAYALDRSGEPVITFSGALEADIYRSQRPYRISPQGGQHERLHDAFGSTPQLSPSAERIAFTRGGGYHNWGRRHYRGPDAMNVWVYDTDSGEFEAITTSDGDDGRAQWVDEHTLVFMSDRELDTVNLYRVDLRDNPREFERLTHFDQRDLQFFDLSRDGSTAVFHVWDRLYSLDLTTPGAEPQAIQFRAGADGHDDYQLRRIDRDVTEAALSPDGKVMGYIAYGRVYIRHMDEHSATRAVTRGTHARHRNLAWAPDGTRLYFSNDEDGTESLYRAEVALTREEIRIGSDGRPIGTEAETERVVEAEPERSAQPEAPQGPDPIDLAMALDEQQAASQPPAVPEDPFGPSDPAVPFDPSLQLTPLDPSPVEPLQEPMQEPVAAPETIPESELDLAPQPDVPRRLDPTRWHDAVQFRVEPLVQTEHNDRDLSPSPDGRSVAFRRGLGDLMILDLESGNVRQLVEGWDNSLHWEWSPDSQYIAYSQNNLDYSANLFIVPADGSDAPVNITRHPRNDIHPRWSADGRILTFSSNRSNDTFDIYRVYLDASLENYTPRQLSTYYRDARNAGNNRQPLPVEAPAAQPSDIELDLENAWRRVTRVTSQPTHQYANEMTPGGDRYVFNSGGQGLMIMNWDGTERRRLGPLANIQHMSLRGDQLVTIVGGQVTVSSLAGRPDVTPAISDRIRINLREESLQKFHEAARMIGENFYDNDMKGLDWDAITEDYAELIGRARTSSEFSDITNRLMGELAASHTGVTNPGPASALREASGRLGIDYEPVELSGQRSAFRVINVVPGGPAATGPTQLQPGDVITAIDLEPFEPDDTMLYRLRGKVGEEVIITFERRVGRQTIENRALLTAIDYSRLSALKYDAFRMEAERKVHELSDGRLGYLHIQAMNDTSLDRFHGDLYAAAQGKDGLIIDVRNNGGGHTTDRILTSITAPDHAYTVPRGADSERTGHYPQDRLHAPRYTLPINMLANEKSYSNAEILAHAFNTLDRGTLIGEQTYGGVISTGSYTLINGATVRRPFRGWYLPDGTDMEHNGAIPDIRVPQTPEDEVADYDRQLETAVNNMLERLDD